MLSRSAERMYWLARYLERSENLARLVSVHMNLLLDLPRSIAMNWQKLLYITGNKEEFYRYYKTANEGNVIEFLLNNAHNPGSLYSSIVFTRENIRTCRNLLPDVAWEAVNELYLLIKNEKYNLHNRRERVVFLEEIQAGCQRFNGLLLSTMSHTAPYYFIKLGQNLERADMCTRILELASMLLAEDKNPQLRQYEGILWVNVLKAQDALAMYRQHVRSKVNGEDVLNYLLKDSALPRSVDFCLQQIQQAASKLPTTSENTMSSLMMELQKHVQQIDVHQASDYQLHREQDLIQSKLAKLHENIAQTWFLTG